MKIAEITTNLINLVYPLHCASCSKPLDPESASGVCDFCLAQIKPNPMPQCAICGRAIDSGSETCDDCRTSKPCFSKASSVFLYEGVIKELIHKFKYNGKVSLARTLSGLIVDFLRNNDTLLAGIDRIAFVPMESARLRSRGFNQSRMLAMDISKRYGMPVSDYLDKKKQTRHQNELSRDDRLVNLNGAFRVKDKVDRLTDKNILILDDVMTTGATLNECAKALLSSGAKEVRCLTLARGL